MDDSQVDPFFRLHEHGITLCYIQVLLVLIKPTSSSFKLSLDDVLELPSTLFGGLGERTSPTSLAGLLFLLREASFLNQRIPLRFFKLGKLAEQHKLAVRGLRRTFTGFFFPRLHDGISFYDVECTVISLQRCGAIPNRDSSAQGEYTHFFPEAKGTSRHAASMHKCLHAENTSKTSSASQNHQR